MKARRAVQPQAGRATWAHNFSCCSQCVASSLPPPHLSTVPPNVVSTGTPRRPPARPAGKTCTRSCGRNCMQVLKQRMESHHTSLHAQLRGQWKPPPIRRGNTNPYRFAVSAIILTCTKRCNAIALVAYLPMRCMSSKLSSNVRSSKVGPPASQRATGNEHSSCVQKDFQVSSQVLGLAPRVLRTRSHKA